MHLPPAIKMKEPMVPIIKIIDKDKIKREGQYRGK
jgi:hypothetical protein